MVVVLGFTYDWGQKSDVVLDLFLLNIAPVIKISNFQLYRASPDDAFPDGDLYFQCWL